MDGVSVTLTYCCAKLVRLCACAKQSSNIGMVSFPEKKWGR
jgi:hypothetical protein